MILIEKIFQGKNEFQLYILCDIYHKMNNKNNKQNDSGYINIIFK